MGFFLFVFCVNVLFLKVYLVVVGGIVVFKIGNVLVYEFEILCCEVY